MTFSWFRISWCMPISECKDKSKLIYLGKKWMKKGTYEYVYLLWTDEEKGKGIYYRSTKLLDLEN